MRLHMERVVQTTFKMSTKRRVAFGKVLGVLPGTKRDGVYPGMTLEETREADRVIADMTRFCEVQQEPI